MTTPYYAIQPAFTGGEISREVASRVDLDKYQLALLTAENVLLRPYGGLYKRPGTVYCGRARFDDKKAILARFNFSDDICYMLEIGEGYIRVWRDGEYLGVELAAPWREEDLPNLRLTQSADVMYVMSGRCPVQVITRYSEDDWRIGEFEVSIPPFEAVNPDVENVLTPSSLVGEMTLTAARDTFRPELTGAYVKVMHEIESQTVSVTVGAANGSSNTVRTDGGWTINVEGQWEGRLVIEQKPFLAGSWVELKSYTGNGSYVEHNITGGASSIRMVAYLVSGSLSADIGAHYTTVDTNEQSYTSYNSTSFNAHADSAKALLCGGAWKIITHGTWTGTVKIEKSGDNVKWETLRTYTSKNDYNAIESGTFEEYTYIRAVVDCSGCTADLTAMPYTHEGIVKITKVVDARQAKVKVVKPVGALVPTENWNFGCWNDVYGYPSCAAFFQDRLVFAGSTRQPHTVWMSRTGDYTNFGVEKAGGAVTDDSAIQLSLISREVFRIRHLVPTQDLVILTTGNEWIISGANTVTPSKVAPKVQTARGASEVEPQYIGNRVVYVQRRGATIRDMGYAYESDNYTGIDLTLLAKHLVDGQEITDSTYSQEPDSIVYFVRGDGALLCLTYVREQEVFAWSRLITDGEFESVAAIASAGRDRVYVLVKRLVDGVPVRCMEYFAPAVEDSLPAGHVMADCAVMIEFTQPVERLEGLHHLKGREVAVVGDDYAWHGRRFAVDDDGGLVLPEPCQKVLVGLPYAAKIELPNFEMPGLSDGTMQGRQKFVAGVTLRLDASYGGSVGAAFDDLDDMVYESDELGRVELYSGDKEVTLRQGGFNNEGRVCVLHDAPYPFKLNAIIRQVVFGG